MPALSLIREGSSAPHFHYRGADGVRRNTNELSGQPYVVYFYPKDDTPGCTAEACGFRDEYEAFAHRGVLVIGVSPDNEASHDKFRLKYKLPFPLACDEDHSIATSFGAWGPKVFMGRRYDGVHRVTFLIDDLGRVAKVYPKVKPAEHARDILTNLPSLTSCS